MSRPPRYTYPRALHHVTLRCNNREFLFATPSFQLFCDVLQEARARFPLSLHNYCLMTNHVHLLFKVGRDDTLPKFMHWLGSTFTRRFNKLTARRGHLWEGRYRSTIIEAASYFFRCMAYVDLNPVRAGLVSRPADHRWSGHRALRAEDSTVLDLPPLYRDLGPDAPARYRAYMALLAEEAARPSETLATKYFVGTPRFVRRMEHKFGLDRRGPCFRHRRLGSGVIACEPRTGGLRPQL